MAANYAGSHRFLSPDDFAGITALYGSKNANNPISGPSLICTTGSFSISGLPSGVAVTWSSSNASTLSINSSTGAATKVGSFNGMVTITATVSNSCGSTPVSRNVWVGNPAISSINNTTATTDCAGTLLPLIALHQPIVGALPTYSWAIVSPSSGYFDGPTNTVSTEFINYTEESTQIAVTAVKACGPSGASITVTTINCLLSYTVFPNPANDYITVSFEKPVKAKGLPEQLVLFSEKSTTTIRTIDTQSLYSRNGFENGNEVKIGTKNLPRGIYYLHVKYSNESKPKIHRIILE